MTIDYLKSWFYPQTPSVVEDTSPIAITDEIIDQIQEQREQEQAQLIEQFPEIREEIPLLIEASIEGNLTRLVAEKTTYFENQARTHMNSAETHGDTIKSANSLLEHINNSSDKDQNVDFGKVPGIKDLITTLKNKGYAINADKTTYTRFEKQDLVNTIEHRIKSAQNDISLHTQKCHQFLQMKSSVHEAAIAIAKALKDLASKIFSAR